MSLKQSYDVIVVGAGPAGATLAYQLAKKGIGVLVLEKENLPRYKCCAGGVTTKAVKLVDFDISEVVEDVVYDVSVTDSSGCSYLGHHSQPLIYMVMRDRFDSLLVKRARQVGAVVMDGQEVAQIQTTADCVEVSTGGSNFRARVVAGADGPYSVVARELGMRRNIEYASAIEMEVIVPEEELAKRSSRVEMDLGSIPGGYAWVFPKRDHLSIGAGCRASKARDLNRCYQRFLNSLNVGAYTVARTSSHLIPTCGRKSIVFQDRALLLGDAAGLADPLTGEGIYNAIQSAQLAASVIERSLTQGKIELQDYQEVIEEKIMPGMVIARKFSRVLGRFPHLALRILESDERAWRDCCHWLCGEMDYTAIKEELGGFKGVFNLLFQN